MAWVGAVNNLAIQYNLAAASVCVEILKGYGNTTDASGNIIPDDRGIPEPAWASYTLLGTVFVGAVLGMVGMGWLGDHLGRLQAMMLALSFALFGALVSAFGSWGTPDSVFAILCASRLILGMGVGGLYPLSAAKTAEADKTRDPDPIKIAWSFFWQTPGGMLPYVVGWILQATDVHPQIAFRIVFGLGALPIIPVLYGEYQQLKKEMKEKASAKAVDHKHTTPKPHTGNSKHWKYLIGTGGSWFLFDISYYGTAIFQPMILTSIFHTTELAYWQNLSVSAMGIPGVIVCILCVRKLGLKGVNTAGFGLTGVLFAVLAVLFHISEDGLQWAKFAVFCGVMFSLNFGPNIATYVIPATLYPTEVRTTFHGLSAGSGKLGAVVGTFIYTPIAKNYGIAAVLWVQAALSFMGMLVSIFFLPKNCQPSTRLTNPNDPRQPLVSPAINSYYE